MDLPSLAARKEEEAAGELQVVESGKAPLPLPYPLLTPKAQFLCTANNQDDVWHSAGLVALLVVCSLYLVLEYSSGLTKMMQAPF